MNEIEQLLLRLSELEKRISYIGKHTQPGTIAPDLSVIENSVEALTEELLAAEELLASLQDEIEAITPDRLEEIDEEVSSLEIDINELKENFFALESEIISGMSEMNLSLVSINQVLSQIVDLTVGIKDFNSNIVSKLGSMKAEITGIRLLVDEIAHPPKTDPIIYDDPEIPPTVMRTVTYSTDEEFIYTLVPTIPHIFIGASSDDEISATVTFKYKSFNGSASTQNVVIKDSNSTIPNTGIVACEEGGSMLYYHVVNYTHSNNYSCLKVEPAGTLTEPAHVTDFEVSIYALNPLITNKPYKNAVLTFDQSVCITKNSSDGVFYGRFESNGGTLTTLPAHTKSINVCPSRFIFHPKVTIENGVVMVSENIDDYHCTYLNQSYSAIIKISDIPTMTTSAHIDLSCSTVFPCFGHFEGEGMGVCGIKKNLTPYAYNKTNKANPYITLNGLPMQQIYTDCVPVQKKVLSGTAIFDPGYIVTDFYGNISYINQKNATYMMEVGVGKCPNAYLDNNGTMTIYYQNTYETKVIRKIFLKNNITHMFELVSTYQINSNGECYEGLSGTVYTGDPLVETVGSVWKIPYELMPVQ